MKRSTERILTTHVGSLIRPPELIAFLRAGQERRPVDEGAFAACLAKSVADIVRRQAEAGIDVVSDGEFGKTISWSQYALERLSGFERRPLQGAANPFTRGADRTRFAEFYAELDARDAPASQWEAACIGPIAYTGEAALQRDIDNLKAALDGRRGERGVPAGGGAGERDPGPQERILSRRRRLPSRDRRRDAQRIPHDRRRRLPGAA